MPTLGPGEILLAVIWYGSCAALIAWAYFQ
jgi:hypothetical protein